MSKVAEIQENLLKTNAAIAELEKAIATDPKSLSLSAMMKSLEKRYQKLETDFVDEVDSIGIDVCSYRIFGEEERPTIKALSSILGDFQALVSTVYDAVKTAGPKERARISAEIATETEFRFGYTFPGSVGVVLTIPNERLLIGESKLDESLTVISQMARLRESPEVLDYAKKLGPASIRALYKWAYDHAESGLGVDLEWRRKQLIRTHLFAQRPELQRLHQIINETSEESTTQTTVNADLVGVDVARRTFRIALDTGDDIHGSLSKEMNISEKQTVELPRRYKVHYEKKGKIYYSTEREDVSYTLLDLEPLS